MLILQDVAYIHPNGVPAFQHIHLSLPPHGRLALIGNNGTGKSTLLRLLAGQLRPTSGTVRVGAPPYYVPQLFDAHAADTVATALGVGPKLQALQAILSGAVTEDRLAQLDDDWTVEERCREALAHWGLPTVDLAQPLHTLSGGETLKVFLAGIRVHQPRIVLLDEPSNHLDTAGREALYDFIRTTAHALVVVSHDRALLNLLPAVAELRPDGLAYYGGTYEFYAAQKAAEDAALAQELRSTEKALRKARDVAREAVQRQQKRDARGRGQQEKAGLPTISMNTLRNNAERSTARVQDTHAGKTAAIADRLTHLRQEVPDVEAMKLALDDSGLHRGKMLVSAQALNLRLGERWLWPAPVSVQLVSGERVAVQGANGSGKTTLLKLLTGALEPDAGTIRRAAFRHIYVDQNYSLLQGGHTVYEQAQQFNTDGLLESDVKSRLTHFLFPHAQWDQLCSTLSGGERLRLLLCCLTIARQAPDLIVLDEPTNNLDLQNVGILTAAIRDYQGTLLVVSHDAAFLAEAGVTRNLVLDA